MAAPDVVQTPDVVQLTPEPADDFGKCCLCQETFDKPKLLRCQHSVCSKCLGEYIDKTLGQSGAKKFPCPSCDMEIELTNGALAGNPVDSFPDDKFMTKLVELKTAIKDDKFCDICVRQDDSVPATSWCMDCSDSLCDPCLKVHLHVKVTSTHSVVSLEEMKQLPLDVLMKKKNKVPCDRHGEFITLFCVDCKEPLCVQCMAVSHRRCENVITVADAMNSRSDVEDVVHKLQSMQASLDVVEGIGKCEKVLEETIETARHEIQYLSKSLRDKIKEQEKEMLEKLDKAAAEAKYLLQEKTEPRKLQVKTIKSAGQRMKTLMKYGSDVEILVGYNQIKSQLDGYDDIENFSPEKIQIKVEFLPNEETLQFLDDFKSLGDARVDTGADEGMSSWGVACTSREDIIVTDCKNKRIQKFNRLGELVDHIQLDDEPRDITTCGRNDDVAVPLIGRLIMFIATRQSLSLIRKAKTERQYDAVSYSDRESYLAVSCIREKRVDLIQLNGEVIKSFQLDAKGSYLFAEPRYLAASPDGSVVVSDIGLNAVLSIGQDGHPLFKYTVTEKELKHPQGVCVDKIGNVFLADNANDRVQLLTSNGSFQRYVLIKDSGLERPCAIVVSNSNKLVIVQNDGMVKVYSYS